MVAAALECDAQRLLTFSVAPDGDTENGFAVKPAIGASALECAERGTRE